MQWEQTVKVWRGVTATVTPGKVEEQKELYALKINIDSFNIRGTADVWDVCSEDDHP